MGSLTLPKNAAVYTLQDNALKLESPPVIATWYTVLEEFNVRLYRFWVIQTNTPTNAKSLSIRVTIDGEVFLHSWSAVHNTLYSIIKNINLSTGGTLGLWDDSGKSFNYLAVGPMGGKSVKVEHRLNDAADAAQTLQTTLIWDMIE